MFDFIKNKGRVSILITGGTGSFGRTFVRKLLNDTDVERIIVFSRDEQKQDMMRSEIELENASRIRYFIGDVRDRSRLELAMHKVDIVVHAAAMKIVEVAEYNPFECIQTNVYGAQNVVSAAIARDVSHVVALSTDKACNPSNLYGASKLAADKIFVAANHLSDPDGTKFSVVRYGNVIGSRGSVVPLFQRLIQQGVKQLPVTDLRMTRFFITLQQSSDFVFNMMHMMQGGEIFVPKIPSMKIVDLADALLPNCRLQVIGIRPGEKLHETIISRDDAYSTFDCGAYYTVLPVVPSVRNFFKHLLQRRFGKGSGNFPFRFHRSHHDRSRSDGRGRQGG
ncbi:MAG: UDP-N-acetylglucosamine 4,6-dehydratase (inverting) [Pseudomonadota bacterium]